MRLHARTAVAAIGAALAIAATGCETFGPVACDRSDEANPPVTFTGGTTHAGVYRTAEWGGELLHFPGGMHYDLVHGLGLEPAWIESFVSFSRTGTEDGGTLAPTAGNQAVVARADDEIIRIVNDSCVDYWLLVTAGVQ